MHSLELIRIKGKSVYKLHLEGVVDVKEMKELLKKVEQQLRAPAADFRVYSDLKGFKPAMPEVQEVMKTIQKMFKERGMKKVALLVDNAVTKMQLSRLHGESGVKGTDRFFAADEKDYQQKIEDFLGED